MRCGAIRISNDFDLRTRRTYLRYLFCVTVECVMRKKIKSK